MQRTFNCGIGMVAIVGRGDADDALGRLAAAGEQATVIGEVVAGTGVSIG
jgi:phosphoribosylaminoimidazole (AIR) synthetase